MSVSTGFGGSEQALNTSKLISNTTNAFRFFKIMTPFFFWILYSLVQEIAQEEGTLVMMTNHLIYSCC